MRKYIKKLSEIKKSELGEREFYEKVLTVLEQTKKVRFTPRKAEKLKQALLEIGCESLEEWKDKKEKNGETFSDPTIEEGTGRGEIITAVNIVAQFIDENDCAQFAHSFVLDGDEYTPSIVRRWLIGSARAKEMANGRKGIADTLKAHIQPVGSESYIRNDGTENRGIETERSVSEPQ